MQYVSEEYKAAMNQAARNKSYMRISLGLVNQAAQSSAEVANAGFTYFSDITKPVSSENVKEVYATFENNFSKIDETMYFLPREGSKESLYNGGIITEEMCGQGENPAVLFQFNTEDPLDIKGLTLEFGDAYPVQFKVQTDEGEFEYTNSSSKFVTEDTFDGTTFMRIVPIEMKNGAARFRIHNIVFGIGIEIVNEKIISAEVKSTISPIAESIPSIDFNVTIENMDKYYNVDNDESAINYMETGQEVKVYYGYTLNDGSIEWVKGATLHMQEWSADDKQAKFGAVDIFEYMQGEYKRGVYRPSGISLYDLAVDVFDDAGINTYWIDPYLKKVFAYNPLPVITHKECLQLIANAGRCVLMVNRDGLIVLKSSFEPDKAVEANQVAEHGTVECLLQEEESAAYATYEENYNQIEGKQYFMPRGKGYIQAEYVSECISDENGEFEINPIITLNLESAYTFFNLTLLFGNVQPLEFVITTYNNGAALGSFTHKGAARKTVINHEFIDVDKITLEFTKARPHNRVHMRKILFGEQTDYEITYDDLTAVPNGTKLEKVKEMRLLRTIYTEGTELKELSGEDAILAAGQEVEIEIDFSDAVHGLSVVCLIDEEEHDFGAEIVDSGSYWCKVRITKPPKEDTVAKITIRGYEYHVSTTEEVAKLNDNGSIQTWENPLISTTEDAKNLVEWVGEYYKGRNRYELKYRGDPILDCNDLAYLESQYVEELMVRLEEVGLKFQGNMSGTLVARRKM